MHVFVMVCVCVCVKEIFDSFVGFVIVFLCV